MTSVTERQKQPGVSFPRAAAVCLCAFLGAGLSLLAITAAPAVSHNGRATAPDLFNASVRYRSSRSSHKAIVYSNEQDQRRSLMDRGATLIDDYGSFAVLSVPDGSLGDTDARTETGWSIRDDMDLILLRAGPFDTQEVPSDANMQDQGILGTHAPGGLFLVQMRGPIKTEWLQWLQRKAKIVSYVPNNAYLVRAPSEPLPGLKSRTAGGPDFVQWVGPYRPDYKVSPQIRMNSPRHLDLTVQLVKSSSIDKDLATLEALSDSKMGPPLSVLNFVDVTMSAGREALAAISGMSNVLWIEPATETKMFDERQDEIIAGSMAGNQLAPPAYLNWLRSRGLDSPADFIVDLADSGIDQGILDPDVLHKAFLSPAGVSRIAYARFLGADGLTGGIDDTTGHGTLNASIIAGYSESKALVDVDSDGYSFGLGVAPFARLGITKVFNPDFTRPDYVTMVSSAYGLGARISSNSWGQDGNSYTASSQIYDALVRDSVPATPGNQEMSIIFAAGNRGPFGNIASPANAKNVIAVGASQNLRPTGTDGCHIDSAGASDADSIIGFSSGGPVDDGRIKPDLVAPGTHIQGALSQDPANNAQGICGPKDYPAGQSLYTWSSGTSHSAPAVAGVAALARQYIQQYTNKQASPALIKAFLINSATYLTGSGAADNLPGRNQGWGRVNLGTALDGEPRMLIDQTHVLTGTGQDFTLKGKIADPNRQLRVTLVWTDAAGLPATSPIMNDLDLRVDSQGVSYLGNNFDGHSSVIGGPPDKLNNAESVWLPEGATGDFTIHVIAANLVADGVPGNDSPVDQDFALVVCNARSEDLSIDSPPVVSLAYPLGGEHLSGGSVAQIKWTASDDRGIVSQKVEVSTDGGLTYSVIGTVGVTQSSFNWLIPEFSTAHARIKITAYDGVNLPVSAETSSDFAIDHGPLDSTPPSVGQVSPATGAIVGGGTSVQVTWTESDNIGVVRRVGKLSTDGGRTFSEVFTVVAPGAGTSQSYSWQVSAGTAANQAALRITVWDGAGNSAAATSGEFQIWALPIISSVRFDSNAGPRGELIITGRNYRKAESQVLVNGVLLKKLSFQSADSQSGTFAQIVSDDPKIRKRMPAGQAVDIVVAIPATGQVSPSFQFTRQ